MLNPIEKFKVAILHLNRAWNHCFDEVVESSTIPWVVLGRTFSVALIRAKIKNQG